MCSVPGMMLASPEDSYCYQRAVVMLGVVLPCCDATIYVALPAVALTMSCVC